MKSYWCIILLFLLPACYERNEKEIEQAKIIRERFDSMGRGVDSFNRKIEREIDSTIHNIDSLLLELDNKKSKK